MSKDDLEEAGLLEVCSNCGSLNLQEFETDNGTNRVVCTHCGTVDFIHTITEEEYEYNRKIIRDE